MTRTIHADLLAEQKKLAYRPALSVVLGDNNLPHPSLIKTPLVNYSANPTASVNTGTAIIRAHRIAGIGLQVQRITNPASTSQWESWTTLDANGNYPALFYTGSRIVLVYQNTSTNDLAFRTSDNDGQTWNGPYTAWASAPFTLNGSQCGISAGQENSWFVFADGSTITAMRYQQSSNSFAGSPPFTPFPGTVVSTSGIYLGRNQYQLAVVCSDYASWTDSAIALQPFTWDGSTFTWGTPTTYIGIQGGTGASPAYSFGHVSLHQVGSWYWLTYAYVASQTAGALYNDNDTIVAVSNDATYFTAGIRINQAIADKLQVHRWSDGKVYLCSDKHLLSSSQVTTVTASLQRIKALDIEDIGPMAYAEIHLDNRDGTYDDLAIGRLGCDITINRGAICGTTERTVARETFVAARFTRSLDNTTLAIHAYNYYRLLELWHAPIPYYYSNITLGNLVESIAALAGIHSVTLESSSIWATMLGEFLIPPGQSAAAALASLQDQFQFLTRMGEGTTLQALLVSSSPASSYAFGPTAPAHPTLRAEDSVERVAPDITHAEVIGSNAGASSIATDLQFETGRQFTYRITREVLTTNTDCATAATAITTKLLTSINRSEVVALPAFHLQPFDAVTAPDGTTRYIARLRETYNPASIETLPRRTKQVYRQTITMAAIAPAAGARSTVDTIAPTIWRKSDFRKGKLVSFDPTTWKALVWLDDTAGAVLLPVARHLHPATLVAGRRVAVMQFDTTNPADGLVVGIYSGTNYWQPFDRLYASDGSPAPAVYTDTAGRLKADYGLDVAGNITATSDVYPRSDARGLMTRLVDVIGTPTDHFRSGSIPSGFAWDAPPGRNLYYNYNSDFLYAICSANTTAFLYKGGAWTQTYMRNKAFTARIALCAGLSSGTCVERVGIRFRYKISGTWYYDQLMLEAYGTCQTQYILKAETTVSGKSGYTTAPFGTAGEFVTVRLLYYTNDVVYAYIYGEHGISQGLGAISGTTPAMTDAQVGLFFQNQHASSYGVSLVDWFHCQF